MIFSEIFPENAVNVLKHVHFKKTTILISFKIVVLFYTTTTKSTTISREMWITQLSSQNEWTLVTKMCQKTKICGFFNGQIWLISQ